MSPKFSAFSNRKPVSNGGLGGRLCGDGAKFLRGVEMVTKLSGTLLELLTGAIVPTLGRGRPTNNHGLNRVLKSYDHDQLLKLNTNLSLISFLQYYRKIALLLLITALPFAKTVKIRNSSRLVYKF